MRIERPPCMTEQESITLDRKGNWWVRDLGRSLFMNTEYRRASERLRITLAPGMYTIGAGGFEHYRETITVTADGVTSDRDPQTLPCITVACAGVLEVPSMLLVPGCEPFELRPPRRRQCDACRGAS